MAPVVIDLLPIPADGAAGASLPESLLSSGALEMRDLLMVERLV